MLDLVEAPHHSASGFTQVTARGSREGKTTVPLLSECVDSDAALNCLGFPLREL